MFSSEMHRDREPLFVFESHQRANGKIVIIVVEKSRNMSAQVGLPLCGIETEINLSIAQSESFRDDCDLPVSTNTPILQVMTELAAQSFELRAQLVFRVISTSVSSPDVIHIVCPVYRPKRSWSTIEQTCHASPVPVIHVSSTRTFGNTGGR